MRSAHISTPVLLVSALLVGCTEQPTDISDPQPLAEAARKPLPPATSGKIAFASDRDGNGEIYVLDADGSNPTRLTNDPGFDEGPSWSAGRCQACR